MSGFGPGVQFARPAPTLVTNEGTPDPTRIFTATLAIGHADLTEVANNTAQLFNIGSALPAGAIVVGHDVDLTTPFDGVGPTGVFLSIGGTDPIAIVSAFNVKSASAGSFAPGFTHVGGHGNKVGGAFGGQQLKAKLITDSGHNLAQVSTGAMTLKIHYCVPAAA